MNSGRHPVGFRSILTETGTYSVEQWAKHIKEVQELAKKSLDQAAETIKKYYDCHSGPSIQYKLGDMVYLDSRNIKTTRPTKKFDNKWFGPFEVVSKVRASVYKLKLPQGWLIHPVFNEILLKLYAPQVFNIQKAPPPPPSELVDNEVEYKVEAIIDS